MTFTPDEIGRMLILSKEYKEAIDRLTVYCNAVAEAMGYHDASEVSIDCDGNITMKCEWFGANQTYDCETFSFPWYHLQSPPELTSSILTEQLESKNKATAKEQRRKEYLRLKEEFENQ
jgi:hypothetical protein